MKLLVFGASGKTGSLVVSQALHAGIEVTAFVRNPEKFKVLARGLTVVQGDVLQPASIDAAMAGKDAVICCLGAPAGKAGVLRSQGTKNIIASMQRFAVPRLICQTSLGYDDSERILENTSFIFKRLIVPYMLKNTFIEHARQERTIMSADINWTIVRPGNMTNGPLTEHYKHGNDYSDKSWTVTISRADTASFLLKQLGSKQYERNTVGISY